jgi:hypothetical protein
MAVYFLRSKHLSRGKGARVTRAAAYRAGELIRDQRTGETYNYSARNDVVHKEIVLPEELAGRDDMAWTQDRATLWNAAEHAGLRCNSKLAREWLVILPAELNADQRIGLVRSFAQDLSDRYKCAVDLCIHEPRPGADSRNHHAHLLMTVREVTPNGFGARGALEMWGAERSLRVAGSGREEYLRVRERWAQLTNHALQHAGQARRIDHRSFAKQGIDREATPSIPEKVLYAERRLGRSTAAGDAIRARHRERVEAREKGPAELARVLARQRKAAAAEIARRPASAPRRELTREERNTRRREYYKAKRAREIQDPAAAERRRAAGRRAYYSMRQKNPQAMLARQRQYRAANAAEINRNQREYRKLHAAELNAKRRELRQARVAKSPTAEESARAWLAYHQKHGDGPTAEESARAWAALRERQAQGAKTPSAGIEAADPKPRRDRGHDFGL